MRASIAEEDSPIKIVPNSENRPHDPKGDSLAESSLFNHSYSDVMSSAVHHGSGTAMSRIMGRAASYGLVQKVRIVDP